MVATAPMAMIPKKQIGNWIELGEKMRMTSFFLTPSWSKPWETFETMDLNWAKFKVSPVCESIRARLSAKDEAFLKRKETIERLGSLGRNNGGLNDLYMPSRPYPDFSMFFFFFLFLGLELSLGSLKIVAVVDDD